MDSKRPRRRPTAIVAYEWASRITTMGLSMALPTLAGWWADEKWGLSPWLTLAGAGLGMVIFFLEVVKLAQTTRTDDASNDKPPEKR